MCDVFISYSAMDSDKAVELQLKLEDRGLTCFLAPKGISPGEYFADRIRKALKSCRAVCLLATRNSLKSEWVSTEWGAAWALGIRVIPILHRCGIEDLPERLRCVQCVDLSDLDKIVAGVEECGHTRRSCPTVLDRWNNNSVCEEMCRAIPNKKIRILQTWIPTDEEYFEYLRKRMGPLAQQVKWEILLAGNPEVIRQRVDWREPKMSEQDARARVKCSLKQFKVLASGYENQTSDLKDLPEKLQVRFYKCAQSGPIFQIEDKVTFIGFYFPTNTSNLAPMIEARDPNSEMWMACSEVFDTTWNKACYSGLPPWWD